MDRSQGSDNWAAMHRAFGWRVPADFNIARACCGRWAERADAAERVAIRAHGGNGGNGAATLSFASLQREANALSNLLASLGVQLGDRVAIVMP
jgi:acetyl-CoA synthetase